MFCFHGNAILNFELKKIMVIFYSVFICLRSLAHHHQQHRRHHHNHNQHDLLHLVMFYFSFLLSHQVGSGYNNEQLKELNQKLSNDWLPFQKSRPPNWLKFPSGFKQKPDVVLGDPSKSIIFQVFYLPGAY